MREKRLSETMSDAIDAIGEAQETLDSAITKAINTHFEAGIQAERERIVELLKSSLLMAVDEKANLVVGRDLMNVDKTSAALVMTALIWAIENREEEK